MSIKIIIADDHPVTRKGLKAILDQVPDFEVQAETENGRSTVEKTIELHPDIVIMDISMPDINGIEATKQVKGNCPEVNVIGLSIYIHKHYIFEMLKAGARGYLSKSCDGDEIIQAIRSVNDGQYYLTPEVTSSIAEDLIEATMQTNVSQSQLSPREIDVLRLLAKGFTINEIAEKLSISAKTVETHRTNISNKLKLKTIPELARYAERSGLLRE